MSKYSLLASVPDILGKNKSQKIIGNKRSNIKITITPSKKSEVASIAEAEDFPLTDYNEEERSNENQSFINNLQLIITLVNYSNNTSYLSQDKKNSRYHMLRSEFNLFCKARQRAILSNGDFNAILRHTYKTFLQRWWMPSSNG